MPRGHLPTEKVGQGPREKQISAGAGLIFKGSGFYITDYRSEKYKEAAKKDSSAASSSGGGESKAAPSDSKPAAKTDSTPAKPAKAAKPSK